MRFKGRLSLFAAALLASAATAFAQRGSNWRIYKAADDLPETLTTAVTIGPHGHVWVRHLNKDWIGRLDGYNVEAIPAPEAGNSRIFESPSGQIWTCTANELLQYQDGQHGWAHIAAPEINAALRRNNLGIFWPVQLCPLKQNQLLVLLPDNLLQVTTDEGHPPVIVSIRESDKSALGNFSSLCSARDGGLWIAGSNGLAKLPAPIRNITPEMSWQEHAVPASLQIRNLREPVEDDDGGVTSVADSAVDGKTVVAYFDGERWSVQTGMGDKITQAWHAPDRSLWVATLTSLTRYRNGHPQPESAEEMPRRIFGVAVETNGIFWLATSDGLMRYAPLTWRPPMDAGISNLPVQAVAEDATGRFWVCAGGRLHALQNDVWTNYSLPSDVASNLSPGSLFPLLDGTIALQAGTSLVRFNPQTSAFDAIADNGQTRLKPLGLLNNGGLCVQLPATAPAVAALKVFDGTNFAPFPYPFPDTMAHGEFQQLYASSTGNIWLIGDQGIAWYHDKKWQSIAFGNSALTEPPSCVMEISDGKLWCGLQDKILEFNGQSWTAIKGGFDHVNAMVRSGDGSLWVASDNGLHRLFHGGWSVNGVEEGLPSPAVRRVFGDTHGRIWATTARGLSLYHADADPDPPQTRVESLPGQNNTAREGSVVTVLFSGEDKWKYTPSDRLLFSWRLDGQEWSPYQEQRSATFVDLSAGKHSFHVRSMDRNWNVDPKTAVLDFTMTVPWYEEARLLFISAAGLGLAFFFAALAFNRHRRLVRSHAEVEAKVALRTQQLELANRELFHSQKMNALGTLAAGIAHDFNNILSIIKGSAQIIEDNLENPHKIRTRTDRIKTVVEQGAGIVNAMLGFSRNSEQQLNRCDVNSVVRETITLLGDRFLRETEVQFSPGSDSLPEASASKDFVQQILLNFIFNAADAMTDRRQVILNVLQSKQLPSPLILKPAAADNYILISVKDFGTGIAPEVLPRIFEPFFTTKAMSARRGTGLGLSMAYELAKQMDCGLHVESAVGHGSTFTLIIPIQDLPVEKPAKGS